MNGSIDFDVVVIGAGAGGGVAAGVLCEAGKRVLLLERGPAATFADVPRDHLRNQRLSLYGHNGGPDIHGNPRLSVAVGSEIARLVRPHEGGYENNAALVGGGTVVYGAQAWRYMREDFRMASTYGVPEGSSLADWPISYDDLEPFYERAEWEIGVAGDGAGNIYQAPRRRGYPMQPVPSNASAAALKAGAGRLGWNTNPAPLAINTTQYNGRPACAQCSYCVGFACPVDAKNGSQNTMIARAMSTGLCMLVTGAMVEQIDTDSSGRVIGATYLFERSPAAGSGEPRDIERRTVRARAVVSSGGAIESARLLLNSRTRLHPAGLGNPHDLVGRNLDGHYYAMAFGFFDEIVQDGIGPGVTISTCRFNHGNPGIIGGAMMANDFTKLPITFWRGVRPPEISRWGLENKHWMRDAYRRTIHIACPVHDIPSLEARVEVEPAVRDRYGIPVAKLSGAVHPETVNTSEFIRERAQEWLRASGASRVWSYSNGWGRAAGQHQAGTCRMGSDPKTSVTDSFGRVHGHDNLFVLDGSLHVTNGGFNPVLTIMALAFRGAEELVRQLQ